MPIKETLPYNIDKKTKGTMNTLISKPFLAYILDKYIGWGS